MKGSIGRRRFLILTCTGWVATLLAPLAGITRTAQANGDGHSGGHDQRRGPGRGIGYEGTGRGVRGGQSSGSTGHGGSHLEDEVFRGQRRGFDPDRGHDNGHDHEEPRERPH